MRSFLVLMVLVVPLAAQAGKPAKAKKHATPAKVVQVTRPFADVPVASLTVVDIRGDQAAVAGKDGSIELVRVGDTLGAEAVVIDRIGEGCVSLKSEATGPFALCTDGPEVPRS